MQDDTLAQWGKLTTSTSDALKELSEISTRLIGKLAQQQLEAVNTSLEAGVRGSQLVSQAKSPQDYVARQTALATEYNEKFLEIARKTSKIIADTQEELTGWIQRQVKSATAVATKAPSPRKAAPHK